VVTIFSSILYIYLYGYTLGFCSYLSIPFRGLNLPIAFYLEAIYSAIFVIISILIIIIIVKLLLIILQQYVPNLFICFNRFKTIISALPLLKNFFDLTLMKKCSILIIFLYIFLASVGYISSTNMGINSAKSLIDGESPQSIEIFFNLKEPISCIANKSLVLIMYYDKNYYVVENQKPAPLNPILFIIPENQINSTSLRRFQEVYTPNPCTPCTQH
jgi:hypothetical protein